MLGEPPKGRNPAWTRDEIILALISIGNLTAPAPLSPIHE